MDKAPKGRGDASPEASSQGSLSESSSQNRLMPLVEAEIMKKYEKKEAPPPLPSVSPFKI